MKKQKLNITLITNDVKEKYSLLGEYDSENQKISYQESNSLLTSVIIDLNDNRFIRDNKDYYLNYQLLENQITENEVRIKELGQSIMLRIKTEKVMIIEHKIEFVYTILDSKETIHYIVEF